MKHRWLKFAKIEATGNDFIVSDEAHASLDDWLPERIRFLCDRHLGIGADGLIFLTRENTGHLRMHYFNADGSAAQMCGNGLRAAALYARIKGFCQEGQTFVLQASDGAHAVAFNADGTISVQILSDESNLKTADELKNLPLPDFLRIVGFVQVGVPHLVLESKEDIKQIPLAQIAPPLRHHPVFPEGANVNVLQQTGEQEICLRTYERGVEDETLSCGTGVTASALLLWRQKRMGARDVIVRTKGGILKVSRENGRLVLTGPANLVFVGHIDLYHLPPG